MDISIDSGRVLLLVECLHGGDSSFTEPKSHQATSNRRGRKSINQPLYQGDAYLDVLIERQTSF